MTRNKTEIPSKARDTFDPICGMPLEVVEELFARARVPKAARVAFWKQAAKKDYKTVEGEVDSIITRDDGTVSVIIGNGVNEIFTTPNDMTDAQLDEFKRAQNHELKVDVTYQEEDGAKKIKFVIVKRKPKVV
ncbi:MAG: hypothetical protein V3T86_00960 [Planctomycetota bacterium]